MRIARAVAVVAAATLLLSAPLAGTASADPPKSKAANPTDELRPDDVGTDIVNGELASYTERPSLITGLRVGGGGPQGSSCTASVVGKRQILTAAHCMIDVGGAKSYLYGDDDLSSAGDEKWKSPVTKFTPHPDYGGSGGWRTGYDVAIVEVADDIPVPESDWAKFATSADADLSQPGRDSLTYGWGKTAANGTMGRLKKTTLPINDADSCQVFDVTVNPELMICAGYDDGRTGICSGDSGGPLIVDGVVIGITSWGASACDRYSIFARLTNAMGDWAHEQLQAPAEDDFSVSLSPDSATVEPGQSTETTVSTKVSRGSAQDVSLTATGLPDGAEATFSPSAIRSGESAKLSVSTSSDTPQGTHRITVTADGAKVDRTAVFTLQVGEDGEGPTADFTAQCFSGPGVCFFNGQGSKGEIASYRWTFGDGGTGQGQLVHHWYAAAGQYRVTLTVTDSRGGSHSTTKTITV
ncbi:trypsin-like serine protease [Stackebrandtia nassauensis]|uniref:Peptidase S1 and S6 chymotrypsin/Hap n=1 Tax=Stackebrandtia nassauensis (strain DSM 44728 / CIP 108903 / NRRL B-16338 / NBRC 102104 / LLR-40K-21) TaxID=446470 RepID=D3QBZ5_STANL|nr:trypsin-like serine protease [Stackebrandtia nassauensis]ADD44884.1 peptidase S1 and S6 chymotrypsin/Hap [Stackebrandtia nassauensis DSM 44728]